VKTINLHKNYSKNSRHIQLCLPISTEFLIPADDSVRLLGQILEELDYSKLYSAYSPQGRNPAVSPKNLFKVIVYGTMEDITESRKLELACRRDVNFMWLLEGESAPDHNTIARFRTQRLADCIEDLFGQFIEKLHALGEIAFENIFIDGTKIEACANKYSFVWKKATAKNEAKLLVKISKFLADKTLSEDEESLPGPKRLRVFRQVLQQQVEDTGIQFVHGTGKRKTQLQRDIETVDALLSQWEKYQKYNALFDGRNSFSKTDTDATFMHMKEDHMRNAQLKPGYNVQIGVEGEYIVHADISSERSDPLTLIPFLKSMEEAYGRKVPNIVADAGYESEENYQYLKDNGQTAYIKPSNHEVMKKRGFKKQIGKRENMEYHETEDIYICAAGKRLNAMGVRYRRSKSGYTATITTYECESCVSCELKTSCTKAAGNKKMEVSKAFMALRGESQANITSNQGIMLRMNRSIQVEGAFGVLKEDHGFRRFLLRGKKNVRTEFLLMSLGYNINKLHNKIQQDRCRQLLHRPKAV
jgi:transposase